MVLSFSHSTGKHSGRARNTGWTAPFPVAGVTPRSGLPMGVFGVNRISMRRNICQQKSYGSPPITTTPPHTPRMNPDIPLLLSDPTSRLERPAAMSARRKAPDRLRIERSPLTAKATFHRGLPAAVTDQRERRPEHRMRVAEHRLLPLRIDDPALFDQCFDGLLQGGGASDRRLIAETLELRSLPPAPWPSPASAIGHRSAVVSVGRSDDVLARKHSTSFDVPPNGDRG